MDRLLGEYRGPTYLRLPAIARILADRIRKGAPGDYELHAWVADHSRVDVPLLLRG
jgi:hypothetical protein